MSADTTLDISHQDRLAVCVRNVNSQGKAIKRLLKSNFFNPENPTILQVIPGKFNGTHV